jgi:CDP-diglyceride synthetase
MHPDLIATLLVLVSIANGAPVLVKKALQDHLSYPIDARLAFFDGRRLFGPSKTIRGAVVSIALTAAAAPLLDLNAAIGVLVGGMAIIGDLFSSFLKRRLDFAPSSRAIGLDQIPESLFPSLVCLGLLPLSSFDIFIVVATFSVAAITLSPIFYRLGIRDRPF